MMADFQNLSIENKIKARNFFKVYELENSLIIPPKRTFLGNRESRVCRFCTRISPQVTFRDRAHVFPDFMNNNKLFSYFECDNCNKQFSLYEDSFAKFLGPSRTIKEIGNKKINQIPKFKNQITGCEIEVNETGLRIFTFNDSDEFIINNRTKTAFLSTPKQAYIPLYVFKSLVKLGLCLISDHEILNFAQTARFLINQDSSKDKLMERDQRFRTLHYSFDHYSVKSVTSAYLFTLIKKRERTYCPEKTLVVYFGNHIFQIMIPFNVRDKILPRRKFHYPIFPLLIPNEVIRKYGEPIFNIYDMSLTEKIYDDWYELNLRFDKN